MRTRGLLTALTAAAALTAVFGMSVPAASGAPARWHATVVPSPSGGSYGILGGVACASATSCVAGGTYYSASHSTLPMIAAESAGRWKAVATLRLPANALSGVDQSATGAPVACPAKTSCVAVGSYRTAAGLGGFIATGFGHKWATAFSPRWPKGAIKQPVGYLTGVSCAGRGTCVAVGGYTDAAGNGEPMVVAESGGHWSRAAAIRLPSDAVANPDAHLIAVSCPKAGNCEAVGTYTTKGNQGEALAVAETKGHWARATEIKLPKVKVEPLAELESVSCVSPGSCVAVGSYITLSGLNAALAVRESGGRWQRAVHLTALPVGAATGNGQSAFLNGVGCTSSECVAVGQYTDAQGGQLSMAFTQSRGKWARAVQVSPPPHGARGAAEAVTLFAVTCLRGGSCTAVGDYTTKSKALAAMAATRG
jgi:hypothetical protein